MLGLRTAISTFIKVSRVTPAWNFSATRNASRHVRPYLRALYNRRLDQGPEKERRRSEFSNWDYDAEIFSFAKRLKEDFDENILRTSFIHKSFADAEKQLRQEALDLSEDQSENLIDNSELINEGETLISEYVKAFLRHSYPYLLEEYVLQVHDHLTSVQSLAYVGAHIGVKDLILSADFPPELKTIADTFKSVVGALQRSETTARAQKLVRDLVLTRLAEEDINQLFEIENPHALLSGILLKSGRSPPESRILRESAVKSVLACYHVGIYSGKEFLGQSPGESPQIAAEEAMKNALWNIFQTAEHRTPLPFSCDDAAVPMGTKNKSIAEFVSESLQ